MTGTGFLVVPGGKVQGMDLELEILRPETTRMDLLPVSECKRGAGCGGGGDVRVGRNPEPLPGFNRKSYTLMFYNIGFLVRFLSPTIMPVNKTNK